MTSYTASGARRTGDEYQDLQSAEVLIEWLENPDLYRWVRLETMEGSLDDIQAERANGTRRLLQVKFGTDATVEWQWDDLLKQERGSKGPRPSLLQKWKTSLDDVKATGVTISEAALLTNRAASAAIRAHLQDSGLVDFGGLPASLKTTISSQLGGEASASSFFKSFHFFFKERSFEVLGAGLQERFRRLGGSNEGWSSLMRNVRRWINRKDEPTPDGTISLADVRAAALWHLPPQIPQDFLVPDDYVAPEAWSKEIVEPLLRSGGEPLVVVTGSPGAGKSTYLSWLVGHLREIDLPVVRHHYFLSTTDATPYRSEWETAADSIIGQLRFSYEPLVRSADSKNPLPGKLREFLEAAGQARTGLDPLVVIVDGLDHVWRDTGSEEGLRRLFDLLLPVPDGVVVVVGTQDIDITRIPRKIRDQCPRDRWAEIPVLDGEGVHAWLRHHSNELGLPEDDEYAARLFDELVGAFAGVTGGHPLVLHYTLSAAKQFSPSVRPEQVRALPIFDPNSSVAAFYRTLWDSISLEGHQLLHLLAGFPWAWPREGLVQCLAPRGDRARFEQAERAIRHVLGTSRVGVTAFHESLLAFVRILPDHQAAAQSLRPQVIEWLTHHAPEFWRWRHEWEERAKNGDPSPLISGPSLEWCISSLAQGRGRAEISKVVAASGWAALEDDRLGIATERHYIDAYLEKARHAKGVSSRLLWLALTSSDPRSRELELNLFLARKAQATEADIETVAEVAFASGHLDICEELLAECADRWNSALRRSDRMDDAISTLQQVLPSVLASSLVIASEGKYREFVLEHGQEPDWCPPELYVKALARHCDVGDDTKSIREELRFLANYSDRPSLAAVDEIVRIACRDGFDPNGWIQNPRAWHSGMLRCYQFLLGNKSKVPVGAPQEATFQSVWAGTHLPNDTTFVELARTYFFLCLACALEGHRAPNATGLDKRADKTATFLTMLRDLATKAAARKKANLTLGGSWLIAELANIEPPRPKINDYANWVVKANPVARVVVAIAQDLEVFHIAETGNPSLTREVIMASINGAWTWERVWIEDRVERRLTMSDSGSARYLIDCEKARLEGSLDYLHTRAEEYGSLAQFVHIHRDSVEEMRTLAHLAARNLLGHGSHKDVVLFDVLAAVQASDPVDQAQTLDRLQRISPIVQSIDKITNGDETSHLNRELAQVISELAPEALPPYLRALQHSHHHWQVESCYTELSRSAPLKSVYERALGATLVHEEALTALQKRADSGDIGAREVLSNTLAHCGRQGMSRRSQEDGAGVASEVRTNNLLPVENYPPEQLTEFVRALRDAHVYGDEPLALWTEYWRSKDPDRLLTALTNYRNAYGYPHENQTAKVIVELALERSGRGAAWDWLVAYHKAVSGWSKYVYDLKDVEWIWDFVHSRFRDRWREFIIKTSRPRWGSAGGAPGWSIERMVLFLNEVGEARRVDEVIDAAIGWAASLAADMHLPAPALTPDLTELPTALRLLVDRLDCPSRMVQERAAWSLAELLANTDSRNKTTRALLDWHVTDSVELRSCTLLTILHFARTAFGLSTKTCLDIVRQATLLPSIGADLLLSEFGDEGKALATSLNYRLQHSGRPPKDFSGPDDFASVVTGHLAPVFLQWAKALDKSGLQFSRQWQWESSCLAKQKGLSLRLNAHFVHHYRGGVNEPTLAINDRLSVLLRSAYLRALHWSIQAAQLDARRAEMHARWVAVMVDPTLWAVRPSERPTWWPTDPGDRNGVDMLSEVVGRTVRTHLGAKDSQAEEILLYAAGPVGNREHLSAELIIRACLQSAVGPQNPSKGDLQAIPEIECLPVPERVWLPGTYKCFEEYAGFIRDWLIAPLSWRLRPSTLDWLLPDRQIRGVHLPATWLFPGAPILAAVQEQVNVTLDGQPGAHFRFWNDELKERHFLGAPPRSGSELVIHRKWLDPQLAAGATLCWIVTLIVTQREEYKDQFGEPQIVGNWIVGGSQVVRPVQWNP